MVEQEFAHTVQPKKALYIEFALVVFLSLKTEYTIAENLQTPNKFNANLIGGKYIEKIFKKIIRNLP